MNQFNKKPAIIIGNGDFEIINDINRFIQTSEKIVVLDSAIKFIYKHTEIVPDVLLGDFDNDFDTNIWKEKYPKLKIIHTPDQEKTDFEKGIEYLIKQGYKNIYGFCLTGKRMDHNLNNISSLAKYNQDANIKLKDKHSLIYCIDEKTKFKKLFDKGTIISLLPIGIVEGITTNNLQYNLYNENLELGKRTGTSNMVTNTDFVEIKITKGKLIVMECND